MADLRTTYMGIPLRNPLIVGACGLTASPRSIEQLEAAGAGALVAKSLFEEEIQMERFAFDEDLHRQDGRNAEMITVHPNVQHAGPAEHLAWVKDAKQRVGIPVFGSLNAVSPETWVEYARRMEETGVDGLECNLFASPRRPDQPGAAVETEQLELVARLKEAVSIPISLKLSISYDNPLHMIHQMAKAGAAGFVLFNRFFEPDIDVDREEPISPLNLSHDTDYRLPLRYAALLEGEIPADVCGSTGIFTGLDVIRMVLAGASAVQTVSALYRYGLGHLRTLLAEAEAWMDRKGYQRIGDFRGKLSQRHLNDPWAYTRAQYARLLMDPKVIMNAQPPP